MGVDSAVLRRLYSIPPEEFVAARDATVKELRAAKDREAAAAVAKLRRPTVADWALNTVAADHAATVGAAVDAAARLRAAQTAAAEGRDGSDVRSALQEMRDQIQRVFSLAEEVVARSGRPVAPQIPAITARLAETAASAGVAEQLRGGHLGSSALEAVDPFAGLTPPPPRPARPGRRAPAKAGDRAPKRSPAPVAAPGRRDDAIRRRRAERATAAARRDQAAALAALHQAEERVAAAQQAVEMARAAAEVAEVRLAAAVEEQRRAAADSARADTRLAQAEAAQVALDT